MCVLGDVLRDGGTFSTLVMSVVFASLSKDGHRQNFLQGKPPPAPKGSTTCCSASQIQGFIHPVLSQVVRLQHAVRLT